MDSDSMLRAVTQSQRGRRWRHKGPVRLGETVKKLMERKILPRQSVYAHLAREYYRMLPAELSGHSRIVDLTAGCLKIAVDCAPYMYEMKLCSAGLLKQLQRSCPTAHLKQIRFVPC